MGVAAQAPEMLVPTRAQEAGTVLGRPRFSTSDASNGDGRLWIILQPRDARSNCTPADWPRGAPQYISVPRLLVQVRIAGASMYEFVLM